MKIITIQFSPKDGKKQENQEKIQQILSKTDLSDVELVLLPELWSTGVDFDKFKELSEKIPGRTTEILSNLAKENEVCIVAGSIVEEENKKLYNTIPVIDKNGKLIEKYRKIHLFSYTDEDKYLFPGQKIKTITIKDTDFGLSTCYDLRFPTQYREMANRGVGAFLCPAAWPKERKKHWKILNKARAIENQAYMISCNRRGRFKDNEFIGNSYIINPMGEIISKTNQKQIQKTEINLEKIKETRDSFPTLKDYKNVRGLDRGGL